MSWYCDLYHKMRRVKRNKVSVNYYRLDECLKDFGKGILYLTAMEDWMKGFRVLFKFGDGRESFMMVDVEDNATATEMKQDIDEVFEMVIKADDPQAEITSYSFKSANKEGGN